MMRRLIPLLTVLIATAFIFTWGFLTHRNNIFPYRLIRSTMNAVGIVFRNEVERNTARIDTAMLTTLGYVSSQYDPDHEIRGVQLHESDLAFQGLNFYVCVDHPVAVLMDMNGVVLHEWKSPRKQWHHAELLPTGDILAVVIDRGIAKLDSFSNEIWFYETEAHHDLWIHDDGSIFAISRQRKRIPEIHKDRFIVDEEIIRLSPDGKLIEKFSVLEAIERSGHGYLKVSVNDLHEDVGDIDILHVNHVEVFDGTISSKSGLFQRGNLLISIKYMNAIAIIDGTTQDILWLWGPSNLSLQHHPTLLENGNILVFDNGLKESRIVEIEVPSGNIVWAYQEEGKFFSIWGGSNQRLPNGNTLITSTAPGYVFEVTRRGDTVWEFANPEVGIHNNRLNIWRMTRYSPRDLPFLASVRERANH
jgi:hypothetical protein